MIDEALVEIKVSRSNDELVYSIDCSSSLTNEELDYYLEEIIKGICEWKPGICSEHAQNHTETIKQK